MKFFSEFKWHNPQKEKKTGERNVGIEKSTYRLCRAVAKQTREAIREEAKNREDITQTPALSKHKHTHGWWDFKKGVLKGKKNEEGNKDMKSSMLC